MVRKQQLQNLQNHFNTCIKTYAENHVVDCEIEYREHYPELIGQKG